jgi:hypothetical protein
MSEPACTQRALPCRFRVGRFEYVHPLIPVIENQNYGTVLLLLLLLLLLLFWRSISFFDS